MTQESIQDRLQREAVETFAAEIRVGYVNQTNLENLIAHTIAETIKAGVSAIEGEMENFASIEHERWAKWQNYLHSHLTWNNELEAWVLLHEWKDRWQMQINKPYSMLSEKEKESDREQVRPYIARIKKILTAVTALQGIGKKE